MRDNKIWELIAKKLSGEASLSELEELEEILRKDSGMHYPMQTVADLWHHKDRDDGNAHEAFVRHASRMNELGVDFGSTQSDATGDSQMELEENRYKKRKKTRYFSLLAILSVMVAMAGIFLYRAAFPSDISSKKHLADKSEVSTKFGSKTKLVLSDGTMVWLNAGSQMSYDKSYGNSLREIYLSGEAFFDVVRNPLVPFIIHTRKIDIKVLGTAFNVKSYPGEESTETSLLRGSVEVTIKDRKLEKIYLKPNEKLVILNDETKASKQEEGSHSKMEEKTIQQKPLIAITHLTYAIKDHSIVETSWLDNKLIFSSQSFENIATELERRFGTKIVFENEALKEEKFTGHFTTETLEDILKAFQFSYHFNYSIRNNTVLIY